MNLVIWAWQYLQVLPLPIQWDQVSLYITIYYTTIVTNITTSISYLPGLLPLFRNYLVYYQYSLWLVVWDMIFFPYMGNNDPNWRIFFRGVGIPPTSIRSWIFLGIMINHRLGKKRFQSTCWDVSSWCQGANFMESNAIDTQLRRIFISHCS